MLTRPTILRFGLLAVLVAVGMVVSTYAGAQLRSTAIETWTRQANQDANRVTEVALAWLSNLRTQLRGVAATHASSSHVSEDELLGTYDILSEIRATIPLATIAFIASVPDDASRQLMVRTSTELDGPIASGADISGHHQLAQTFDGATGMPDRVVMGPVFDSHHGQRLAAIAMAAVNGDEEGVVLALVDVGDLMNSLVTLHMDPGLDLRLVESEVVGTLKGGVVIFDNTVTEDVTGVFSIDADVGHTHWEFGWHLQSNYNGGPEYQLARFVFLTGSALTLMVGAILGLLLMQNARIIGPSLNAPMSWSSRTPRDARPKRDCTRQ